MTMYAAHACVTVLCYYQTGRGLCQSIVSSAQLLGCHSAQAQPAARRSSNTTVEEQKMTAKIRTLDEFEAEYKAGLGEPLSPRPWRTITEEWLERFGDGVGDFNPLWRDSNYANKSRFGGLVASPLFTF